MATHRAASVSEASDCFTSACITIRRAGVEGRGLRLRDLLDFAVQLAGGGLVELDGVGQAAGLDGVQESQRPDAVHVGRVLGQVKGHLQGDGQKERRVRKEPFEHEEFL